MLNKLRVRTQSESGFTLVELLVVMLILGLLAAIAIPAFFNQRDKARDSEAKTTAQTAQTAIETYSTDDPDGSYTGATAGILQTRYENTLDLGILTAVTPNGTGDGYTITATAESTDHVFNIVRAPNGTVTHTCSPANEGGCGALVWD